MRDAEPRLPEESSPSAPAEGPVRDAKAAWLNPWVIVAGLALALAGWQWGETRSRLSETQQEVARRLSESEAIARESRAAAKQAQEQSATLLVKIGELEGKLAESKGQQAVLETLYENLARSRDEWLLAEVEQAVMQAIQQLQLGGNVQGAMLALQSAESRLAGNSRLQFVGLRKMLNRDLDRLRALPQVDLIAMNQRLESMLAGVDVLPLAVDVRPQGETAPATNEGTPVPTALSLAFWRHLAGAFWQEVRGLIRIQRFDREEPALLAPGQAYFLRENLKLRLLNARLALMARDQWAFRRELAQIQSWVERYFDGREKSVKTLLLTLRQLSATEIGIEFPTLTESLSAIRGFNLGKGAK